MTTPFAFTKRGSINIARVADLDKRAFEQAVEPLMPDLLAYFARRVEPREDSADCLSETMLVLWRRRRTLPETNDALRAWAFGVARNVLSNYNRGQVRRSVLAARIRDELALRKRESHAGLELLDALPPAQREMVKLIVWDGFGVAEAGALLGMKPSAARMAYARARESLRKVLPG